MRKTILTFGIFLLSNCGIIFSQGVMDAYKYSQTELLGTARSVSMGGAMGAMGNDISAISVNPAGIGLYKKSNEIVTTLNVSSMSNETFMGADKTKKDKTTLKFNNLAYVGSFYLGSDAAPFLNVGFSYNRLKNFDNSYVMQGSGYGPSISHLMADRANGYKSPSGLLLGDNNNKNIDVWRDNDWLAVMGYNSGMIKSINNGYAPSSAYYDNPYNKYLYNREKGGVNSYDFNIGTEIEKMLSIGLSFSVTDINYHLYSLYGEDFSSTGNPKDHNGYSDLNNYLKTEGTGYQVSLGLILKPSDFISLGVAYHSPTWYDMTDYSYANFEGEFNTLDGKRFNLKSFEGADAEFDYRLRTPDRWVFSLAGFIRGAGRNIATISADYELTNYKGMKLNNKGSNDGNFDLDNKDIKDYFRMASTLRVGTEIAFTPQFFGRLGYSWQQAAMKDDIAKKIEDGTPDMIHTAGSVTQFVVNGDTNYFTWGLGYRFNNGFFTDVAFSYKNQKNKLYSTSLAEAVELKNNTYQGLFTLGYRFVSF